MTSDAHQLWELEQFARKVERKQTSIRTGYFPSALDEQLDAHARSVLPRQDLIQTESVERVLLFLRTLFAQHPSVTWRGDGEGFTDVSGSDIVIESHLAPNDRQTDAAKPVVMVRPGPASQGEVSIENLKHWDLMTDSKTYTSLDPGTIQILVHYSTGAGALELAGFIANALRANKENLYHRGFHKIQNVAIGGYDQDNPSYNRQVDQRTNVVIPITFTFFYQSTWRVTNRARVFELALGLVHGIDIRETPPEPDPYIDGRADGVLESVDVRVIVPLDFED